MWLVLLMISQHFWRIQWTAFETTDMDWNCVVQIVTDVNEFGRDTQTIFWNDVAQIIRVGKIFTGKQMNVARDNFTGREKSYDKLGGLDWFIF